MRKSGNNNIKQHPQRRHIKRVRWQDDSIKDSGEIHLNQPKNSYHNTRNGPHITRAFARLAWSGNGASLSTLDQLRQFLYDIPQKSLASKAVVRVVMQAAVPTVARKLALVTLLAKLGQDTPNAVAFLRGLQACIWQDVRSKNVNSVLSTQALDVCVAAKDRMDLLDAILMVAFLNNVRVAVASSTNDQVLGQKSLTVPLHSVMPLSAASSKYPGIVEWIVVAIENAYNANQLVDMLVMLKVGELHGKGRTETRTIYFPGSQAIFEELSMRLREKIRAIVPRGLEGIVSKECRGTLSSLPVKDPCLMLAIDCVVALVHLKGAEYKV